MRTKEEIKKFIEDLKSIIGETLYEMYELILTGEHLRNYYHYLDLREQIRIREAKISVLEWVLKGEK